ncbi:MAG: NUDIX hydrolase [Microthrixaceae bacterium]
MQSQPEPNPPRRALPRAAYGETLRSSKHLDVARAQFGAAMIDRADAARHRDRILAFIDEHADAARRSCASGHLTGSAVVVNAEGNRALLMLHAKVGRWLQMGGHADGDTNLCAVALREATEESGIAGLTIYGPAIDVDAHAIARSAEPAHQHLDLRFLVIAPPGAQPHGNAESRELRWVSEGELDTLTPPIDQVTSWLVRRAMALAAAVHQAGR